MPQKRFTSRHEVAKSQVGAVRFTMTPLDAALLFVIMLGLAATPSASVALVVSRAAMYGVRSGAAVAAGIVAGDLVFVILAVLGLSSLAQALGPLFIAIKLLGGAYLIFTGVQLLRTGLQPRRQHPATPTAKLRRVPHHHATSFLAGFVLTLGDVKAILFYASLFPTVTDMTALTYADIVLIIGVTVITVGGVKLAYAFAARRLARLTTSPELDRGLKLTTGSLMIGAGTYLIVKP